MSRVFVHHELPMNPEKGIESMFRLLKVERWMRWLNCLPFSPVHVVDRLINRKGGFYKNQETGK